MFFKSKKDKSSASDTPSPEAPSSTSAPAKSSGAVPPAQMRPLFDTKSGASAPAAPAVNGSRTAPPTKPAAAAPVGKDALKIMGQVSALMMRAPGYADLKLSDLSWLVVPAIQHGQFAVAEATPKEGGKGAPVGAVLWALVSDDLDKKLSTNPSAVTKLTAKDWKSGKNAWFVCVIGSDKITKALMQKALETSIKGAAAKALVIGKDGRVTMQAVSLKRPN